jgi:thiaminase/transcriptional activator TenA
MTFYEQLLEENLPIWEECLETEFLQKLENGTLDEEAFKGYIVDDSLYLREYAKVFAWGMTRATDWATLRLYYSLLAFVNEGEGSTRLYYLQRYGLRDEDIQHLPQRPENKAYTDTMLAAAQNGGAAECMMACLPCMVSYGYIFRKLLARTPAIRETPYWPLVRDYAGEAYAQACDRWVAQTEALCTDLKNLAPERAARCRAIFKACSLHEKHFWEMSTRPRSDLG